MNDKVLELLIQALVLFTCIPVHECAHAWAADKMGDHTGRDQGRITLNPFAHLTLWGSLMMVFVGFGWGKPVMVDPRNFKNPKKGMMLSSLAGPASNLIMAFLAMIVCRVLYGVAVIKGLEMPYLIGDVFRIIALLNIGLAVFNFLPIPPLDGSKIFNALLPEKLYFKIMSYERYIFFVLIVLLYTGLLDKPLSFLNAFAYNGLVLVTNWVDLVMIGLMGGGI